MINGHALRGRTRRSVGVSRNEEKDLLLLSRDRSRHSMAPVLNPNPHKQNKGGGETSSMPSMGAFLVKIQ